MPIGTGADILNLTPGVDYVSDSGTFNQLTKPNVSEFASVPHPGASGTVRVKHPQVGVVGMIRATFVGEVEIDTGGTTTTDRWPHGLAARMLLGVNGQDKLVALDGEDAHVLRHSRNPAYTEEADVYPSTLGGGAITAGTHALNLGFEIPVAMDMVSLVGALYAQSGATNIDVEIDIAPLATLFADTSKVLSLDGTWYFETTNFAVPRDAAGKLVVPDLSRLHSMVSLDVPFTNGGEVVAPLIRGAGQLTRLFLSARKGTTSPLSADPATAAANRIETVRLEYGGNERPLNWRADSLFRKNNAHYGTPLPYGRVCIDLVRDNPTRDALVMLGVTELKAYLGLNSAVTPAAGAGVHLFQETLFAAAS